MVKKQDVFRLVSEQVQLFLDFKAIGEKKKTQIIKKTIAFIRGQLNYNPDTGQCNKAVIGVSGGVDSALVLALAVEAVGPDNVIAVEMPDEDVSSDESVSYANILCELKRVKDVRKIPIKDAVQAFVSGLKSSNSEVTDFEIGNIRARVRMIYLYAIANKCNGRVLDTCNLTEIMMGYFTKYGDGASDCNPIGKIYKTWVWIIAAELGVPKEIINKKPSAELVGRGQTDEMDMGINYSALDLMLHLKSRKIADQLLIRNCHFPKEAIEMVNATIERNAHKSKPVPMCNV